MLATPRRRVAAIVFVLLLLLLTLYFVFQALQPKPGAAAQESAGFSLFLGSAQLTKVHTTTAIQAHTGDQLATGDTVSTAASSKAAINYPDGSVSRLDSNSTVQVSSLAKASGGGTQVVIDQAAGRTWHNVKQLAGGASFKVKGPNSTTAEVRGTTFSVYVLTVNGQTIVVIDNWSGSIAVRANGVTVTLAAGQSTSVAPNSSPTAPGPISAADRGDSFTVFNQALDAAVGQPVAFGTGTLTSVASSGPQPGTTADGQTDLYFTEGWPGSEFQLDVSGPGAQNLKMSSKTPPVTISVPCASAGQWGYDVTALNASNEVWWVVVSQVPHGKRPTPSSGSTGTTTPCGAPAPSPSVSPSTEPALAVTPSVSPSPVVRPQPSPSSSPTNPVVTGISPNNGPALGATNVTITGLRLTGASGVSFGGTPAASFTPISATQVSAVSPLHVGATVDVQVTTPNGTSAPTPPDRFTLTNWTNVTPASPAPVPPVREGQAMALDAANNTTVLFGGELINPCCTEYADTWTWDGAAWTLHMPRRSPSGRLGAAMAYDPGTQTVVLMGGDDCGDGCILNDIWRWNGIKWTAVLADNGNCTDLTPCASQPPRRAFAALAYDGAELVLFGGGSRNDTWISKNGGATWTQVQANNPSCPCGNQPLQLNSLEAFSPGGSVVLVQSDSSAWKFVGANSWAPAAALPIEAADGGGLAYDAKANRTIYFGGDTCGDACFSNQTWRWDGSAWVHDLLPSPNTSPPIPSSPVLAGDPGGGVVLQDGGNQTTWVYV